MRRRSVASCLSLASLLAAASGLAQPAPKPGGAQPAAPVAAPAAPVAAPAAQPETPAAPPAPAEPRAVEVSDPALAPVPPAKRSLKSWRDVLTLISARSPDLIVAVQEIARAQGQARQALAQALPSINASASVDQGIIPGTSFVPGVGLVVGERLTTMRASITATQPLLAPRAWYGIETAKLNVEIAKMNVEDRQRVVLAAVADAVVNVVTAERVAEINRVGLRSSLELLELTRRRAELGTGTKLDVVRAEQDVAQARSSIVTGDESLRKTREALGLALGTTESFAVDPGISLNEVESSLRSICAPGASDTRPDVRAARAQVKVAERGITDAKLAFAPRADVSTTAGSSYVVQSEFANNQWSIQALLTVPIWDGGARYGATRAARAQAEQQKARADAAARTASLEQTQATRGIEVAEQARAVAAQARDLAAETARLTRVAFNAGTATSFELVQAQQALRQAEQQLALREFELVRAKIVALLASSSCRY